MSLNTAQNASTLPPPIDLLFTCSMVGHPKPEMQLKAEAILPCPILLQGANLKPHTFLSPWLVASPSIQACAPMCPDLGMDSLTTRQPLNPYELLLILALSRDP